MNDHELATLVRRADPDRFTGTLFAPASRRRDLLTLYALNHELARAREVASTPPLALIRLHWWREVIEGAARDHPLARALHETLNRGAIAPHDLLALVDAREAEAEPIPDHAAFMAYIRATAGGLMRTAATILGVTHQPDLVAIEHIGTATGIAFLLRAAPALRALGRDLLPQDGTGPTPLIAAARTLLATPTPSIAIPATLPAILARRDLARLERGLPARPRGIADRIAMILAARGGNARGENARGKGQAVLF